VLRSWARALALARDDFDGGQSHNFFTCLDFDDVIAKVKNPILSGPGNCFPGTDSRDHDGLAGVDTTVGIVAAVGDKPELPFSLGAVEHSRGVDHGRLPTGQLAPIPLRANGVRSGGSLVASAASTADEADCDGEGGNSDDSNMTGHN